MVTKIKESSFTYTDKVDFKSKTLIRAKKNII